MGTTNFQQRPTDQDFTEIVFENRNKSFGAYVIRRTYADSVLLGLIGSTLFIGLLIGIPYLLNALRKESVVHNATIPDTDGRTLEEIYTVDQKKTSGGGQHSDQPNPDATAGAPVVGDQTNGDEKSGNPEGLGAGGFGEYGLPDFGDEFPGDGEEDFKPDTTIHRVVPIMPTFPGGIEALREFFKENIIYPEDAKEYNISGKVVIGFVVDENGAILEATISKDIGFGCGDEALRVTKIMPRWRPGMKNGKAVKVKFQLPVDFSLQ